MTTPITSKPISITMPSLQVGSQQVPEQVLVMLNEDKITPNSGFYNFKISSRDIKAAIVASVPLSGSIDIDIRIDTRARELIVKDSGSDLSITILGNSDSYRLMQDERNRSPESNPHNGKAAYKVSLARGKEYRVPLDTRFSLGMAANSIVLESNGDGSFDIATRYGTISQALNFPLGPTPPVPYLARRTSAVPLLASQMK